MPSRDVGLQGGAAAIAGQCTLAHRQAASSTRVRCLHQRLMFSARTLKRTASSTRGLPRTRSFFMPWQRLSSEFVASIPERILCRSLKASVCVQGLGRLSARLLCTFQCRLQLVMVTLVGAIDADRGHHLEGVVILARLGQLDLVALALAAIQAPRSFTSASVRKVAAAIEIPVANVGGDRFA